MRQKSFAVVPRKFPLCSTNSHLVQAVSLAVLVRNARPVTAQYLVAKNMKIQFPLPGRPRETRPVRFVHPRDDPTLTTNRLVSGDIFHFESSKRNRNVVLSNVVRGLSLIHI